MDAVKLLILTQADFANLSLIAPPARLRRLLERATVVASDVVPAEIVTMNTQVVLVDDGTRERRIVRVVYPEDADATRGFISVLDPLGTCREARLPAGAQPAHSSGDQRLLSGR